MTLISVSGCEQSRWNSPYELGLAKQPTLFSSFSSKPKHLDPVISYNANEWSIIGQVYEPPLQYHYLKRPYSLEPLTLQSMPEVTFLNEQGQPISKDSTDIAFSEYTLYLNPSIRYQPHPAFVKDITGHLTFANLSADKLSDITTMEDFKQTDTRLLMAEDYAYAIKRMAVQLNNSPILGTMKRLIVGLSDFSEQVSLSPVKPQALQKMKITGVQVVSGSELKIRIYGKYPQFLYWLSMNFFAPIPWEAEVFYNQPGLAEKNISLDTYPVGTGAYQLVENNPNKRMRLVANPNYDHGFYPESGLSEGADPVLLKDAGKQLPFIKEVVYSLEKESVPLWNKFLQGYYDASGVSSDSFDQAISISGGGHLNLTPEMKQKGIQFLNTVEPTIYYFGFNMADPVVGGYSKKQRKLRQALSIALNFEEYISIFMNGRGVAAQGPIPPGIFGHESGQKGINSIVYDWKNGHPKRKPIEVAKKLLAEAGYPNGRKSNGEPLVLHYDTAATGPDSKAQLNWYRKQFAKLGIQLVIRATDYNRFQDKMRGAKGQMFTWGWNADYPDPENFLFLLNGAQSVTQTRGAGINYANYDNPEFNRLFKKIKTMENSPERLALIQKMVRIVQKDAPWAWGFNPKSLALYHSWYHNVWPNPLANNTLKYKRIDAIERVTKQKAWNKPVIWPIVIVLLLLLISIYPLIKAYQARQKAVVVPHQKGGL
ncbi:ABC transporter substrate-binding protein [Hydrogenovibrio sp. 3SP14C1]|uniref:ABC transporter substrate-binding protein n=1 Tax=Hydrogenovibrio sp. 3SP14C1 TaxID=3038774 RepID=UPI002417E7F6|nr:ABC transporter substrate-binding protein [Hydrogenovibrio sp. 3SP14C1]MDG4812717.1 ABC transporter substrate-binding protein [Hydrogenovibrio sp. 3SP14C1]